MGFGTWENSRLKHGALPDARPKKPISGLGNSGCWDIRFLGCSVGG